MNEKILKAIKSLKDEIDTLKQEKKDDLDLELIKEKITTMIQGYHIKDKHWYYDDYDTGIVAEGKTGPIGPKGEAFKFDDFTPEQLILLTGADGKPGKDGINGKDGKPGKDGINGKDGKPGKDGINGKDGKDAVTPEFIVRNVKHVSTQTPPKFEMEKIDDIYYIDVEIPRGKVGTSGRDGSNGRDGVIQYKAGENIVIEDNIISATSTMSESVIIPYQSSYTEEEKIKYGNMINNCFAENYDVLRPLFISYSGTFVPYLSRINANALAFGCNITDFNDTIHYIELQMNINDTLESIEKTIDKEIVITEEIEQLKNYIDNTLGDIEILLSEV